ncbi:MAG TPA: hypothetical protein GX395_06780 [Clostridia bacterium]|nr:hypothetical protein [Clostridia bacterium]
MFLKQDKQESGNARGKVFEYIVYKIGPIRPSAFISQEIIVKKRQCYIETKKGGRVGGEKNFDLGFHSNCIVNVVNKKTIMELLENKVNLSNELFTCDYQLADKAREKLKYMRTVKNALMCCKAVRVALVTLLSDVSDYKEILDKEGFGCIEIYTINEIEKLLNCEGKTA